VCAHGLVSPFIWVQICGKCGVLLGSGFFVFWGVDLRAHKPNHRNNTQNKIIKSMYPRPKKISLIAHLSVRKIPLMSKV
jgi:hypothetical protein